MSSLRTNRVVKCVIATVCCVVLAGGVVGCACKNCPKSQTSSEKTATSGCPHGCTKPCCKKS